MNKKLKLVLILIVLVGLSVLAYIYFSNHTVAVLQPRGPIALKERNLFLTALGLMLIVVIPVFIITFFVVYNYREGHKGKYRPEFDHSRLLETTWWLIPSILITVLATITWNSSHQLDPFKSLISNKQPLTVEVVSMDWKWLFIYPTLNIASVNQLNIPTNIPINFYITSDSVMNSFWVPQLGGQIYSMPGMSTQLHLLASQAGSYYGSSANISGNGFASMHFQTVATNMPSFKSWVSSVRKSKASLSIDAYATLNRPSINNPVTFFKNPANNLYASIIERYMAPGQTSMDMGAY